MKKLIYILVLNFICLNAYSQVMNVTYKTIKDSNTQFKYNVSATYPQVEFGPDALMGVRGIASDINNSLEASMNGIISSFETEVKGMPADAGNGTGSSLEITSRGWVSNGSLFSSEVTVFSNIDGMVHPLTTVLGYNYDVNGAGPLQISDLFLSNSDYVKYLSEVSIMQLTAYAEKEGYTSINDMIQSGASADVKNFNNWVVENDSLIIIFKPYQTGPYVMGIQKVSVQLSDLVSMIDPKGPIGYMQR